MNKRASELGGFHLSTRAVINSFLYGAARFLALLRAWLELDLPTRRAAKADLGSSEKNYSATLKTRVQRAWNTNRVGLTKFCFFCRARDRYNEHLINIFNLVVPSVRTAGYRFLTAQKSVRILQLSLQQRHLARKREREKKKRDFVMERDLTVYFPLKLLDIKPLLLPRAFIIKFLVL